MEIITSFLMGFVAMWFALRLDIMKPSNINKKETLVGIANTYGSNKKICKELKYYSINQIKHGNYEYIEFIDTIKRQNNDKTRT